MHPNLDEASLVEKVSEKRKHLGPCAYRGREILVDEHLDMTLPQSHLLRSYDIIAKRSQSTDRVGQRFGQVVQTRRQKVELPSMRIPYKAIRESN
jgi:hypothetical protein